MSEIGTCNTGSFSELVQIVGPFRGSIRIQFDATYSCAANEAYFKLPETIWVQDKKTPNIVCINDLNKKEGGYEK